MKIAHPRAHILREGVLRVDHVYLLLTADKRRSFGHSGKKTKTLVVI
jgi:hypothetical protein